MTTSISEFEREKPIQAYECLNRLIKKYSTQCFGEEMDDKDAAIKEVSKEVKDDLLRFKIIFLSGK